MFKISVANCLLAVWAVAVCSPSLADVHEVPAENGQVFKMTVTPAAETVPAFKYRLSVEPHKTIAGNAITHYLRSLGERSLDSPWDAARKSFGMDVHKWYSLETSDEDIPLDKLREASSFFDSYIDNHIRRATLCRDCDWGLAEEDLRGKQTVMFLLPSVQQTRSIARVLSLRNRLAVMEGRYEDSIDHLRMTYQLGQNVNRMKFLVANLVAIAEIGIANEGMLTLVSAKGSPNMYWALAELPRPIVSIRDSLRLEASFGERYFPVLMNVETAKYTAEEWTVQLNKMIVSIEELSRYVGSGSPQEPSPALNGKMLTMASGLAGYTSAKKRLLDSGMDAEVVDAMPVAQVILIDAARDYRFFMNEMEKAAYVPFQEFREFQDQANASYRYQAPGRLGALIVNSFAPALGQVRQAEVRIQAQVNLLMVIESIRNHLATTGGLPKTLSELKLPVRDNPLTGQPFSYQVKGKTAVIEFPIILGKPYSFRYEISVAE